MATTSSVPANTYIEKAPDAPNERKSSKPCSFFAQGTCRNGSDCRFSHDTTAPLYSSPPPGNPVQINIPPNHQVFSIDVECVATGVQHNSRSVAQVALVDEWCRPVFNAFIKQDKPVVSYLTPLTGLTQETLDKYGMPLGKLFEDFRFSRTHFAFFACSRCNGHTTLIPFSNFHPRRTEYSKGCALVAAHGWH